MKKILIFICGLLLIGILAGCEFTTSSDTPAVYKISYYDHTGKELFLTPSTYEKGESFELPTLKDIGEAEFLGWYINKTGLPITKVEETNHSNLKLYAAYSKDIVDPVDPVDPTPVDVDLSKYAPTSYKAVINDSTIFEICGNISHIKTDNVEYVFIKENNSYTKMYLLDNKVKEDNITEDAYIELVKNYYNLNFAALVGEFELVDSEYQIIGSKANDICQKFFNNSLNYVSLNVKVVNNMIICVKTITSDNLTFNVVFSTIEKIDPNEYFIVPPTPITNDYPISDALESNDGEKVIVMGKIIGTVGNNFYISDGTDGIYIYPNNTAYRTVIEYGKVVIVKGTITTYNGLREVQSIESIEEVDDEIDYQISDVTLYDLNDYPSLSVNLKGLIVGNINSLPSDFGTGSKDAILEVTDGKIVYTLIFHKNLKTAVKTSLYKTLKDLTVGDVINLDNVVVSYYKGVQLAFTDQTILTIKPVIETGLFASKNNVLAEVGTSLNDLLNGVTFYYLDEEGNKTDLTLDDLEMTDYDSTLVGHQSIIFAYLDELFEFNIRLYEESSIYRPTDVEVLDDVLPRMGVEDGITYGVTSGLPNTGNPKVLVIPVTFSNYPAPAGMKERLEKAFFGTSTETGWESLQSYYYKSSFGKLHIEGTVLEPFNTNKRSTYYDSYEDTEAVNMIIKAALSYYDSTINYNDYDTDNDGYIDAIYLVYTCPVEYEDDYSLYWAFSYEYYTDDYEYYDDVEADYYCFFGYDFLDEELACGKTISINAETIIHETGHLLGLDDYYDYDDSEGPDGGLGGSDMMDYNIGDHNTYSKAILGWINPYVVDGYNATVEIGKANTTGDAIIVTNKWNDTYFDEYLLIEYYTPDGLNALEAGYDGQFTTSGIKIYHVSAGLNDPKNAFDQWTITKDNNSDTTNKLITYIEADGNNDIINFNDYSENSDLFKAGSSFTFTKWYYTGNTNIKITILSVGETAKISIEFN